MSLTNGQLPNSVGVDDVANVEVGVRIAAVLEDGIQDKRSSERTGRRETRRIVERMRQRVVEVHRQRRAQTFSQRDRCSVVVRFGNTAERRECPVLRLEEQVVLRRDAIVNSLIDYVLNVRPVVAV